jgi:LysM repeat protein
MAKLARTGFFWLVALALVISTALSLYGQSVPVAFAGGAILEDEQTYEVQIGDTLFHVAERFDISVAELIQANGLQGNIILSAGQTLIIPQLLADEATAAVGVAPKEEPAVMQQPVEKGDVRAAPEAIESPAMVVDTVLQTYRVQRYDSLARIAGKFGISVQELAASNGLYPSSFLHRQQILVIPTSSTTTKPVSAMPITIDVPEVQHKLETAEVGVAGGDADDAAVSDVEDTAAVDTVVEDPAAGTPEADGAVAEDPVSEDVIPEEVTPPTEEEPGAEGTALEVTDDDDEIGAAPSGAVAFPEADPAEEEAGGIAFWNLPESRIQLFSPSTGGAYHSALDVTGLSRTFEGNVGMYLVDEAGSILARRFANGGTLDEPSFFHTRLRFTVTEPTPALLKVFEIDARDGSRIDEVQISITLLPGQRAIDIDRPAVGEDLCAAVFVTGYSNTFEATVILELWDAEGELLEQTFTAGGTLGVYRNFFAAFDTRVSEPTPIFVAVYEIDASGRFDHIDKSVIPATLFPESGAACN